MRIMLFMFVMILSLHAEDFITKMEYAQMLYANPRGIGCNLCHGLKGEGTVIAKYKVKGKKRELVAPPINQLSKERFFNGFEITDSVMPKYFLTNKEIEALYFYVTKEQNENRK